MEKTLTSIDTASLTISADFAIDSNNATKAVKVTEEPNKDKVMETYDHNAIAVSMVQFQVEYHFSDSNLEMDNYLLCRMHEDKDYWVPVSTVANLTKIKSITEDPEIVLKAIRASDELILNDDETKVKRPNFVPPKPKHHKNLRRTVFMYGIPKNYTKKQILDICEQYGKVKSIEFDINVEEVADKKENQKKHEAETKDNKNTLQTKPNDVVNKVENNSKDDTPANKKKTKQEKKQKNDGKKKEQTKEVKKEDATNNKEKEEGTKVSKVKQEQSNKVEVPRRESVINVVRPDHSIAITIMTKKFGPKAVRSNSSYTVTNRASFPQSHNVQPHALKRAATHSHGSIGTNSFDFAVEMVPPHAPVYVHPVPNPNGDPLDFSHLKSCFVVYQSQSQANKCVKNRARSEDGIRAMTQYDYNQFKKRVSLARARGISPLISPNSIALALTSPTFALLGSQKHSQHSQQHYSTPQHNQTPNGNTSYPPTYQQQSHPGEVSNQANNAMAMDYYLANSQVTLTMAELQQLIEKMQKKPPQTTPYRNAWNQPNQIILNRGMMGNKFNPQRRNTHHYHQQFVNGNTQSMQKKQIARNTWSHRQQQQHPKIFDFDGKRSNQRKNHRYRNSSHNKQHDGSRTSNNRYKSRGNAKHYQNNRRKTEFSHKNGRFPPAPTPCGSFGKNQATILVRSKTPVQAFAPSNMLSPAGLSPHVSIIRGPADGFGILDRK